MRSAGSSASVGAHAVPADGRPAVTRTLPTPRPVRAAALRLAGAVFAVGLLAAGCGGTDEPAPETAPSTTAEASEGGTAEASDGGTGDGGDNTVEPSDGGGQSAAEVPMDPIAVTPAPEGFEPPAACTNEGAHLVTADSPAAPALPERGGQTATIELAGIEGEKAHLTVAVGDGEPRPVEAAGIGETIGLDQWTISITSVCGDQDQVEFDLID